MKKISFIFVSFFLFSAIILFPQSKIGYVDSDTIFDELPEARDANQRLDVMIQEWQTELNKLDSDWKAKYDEYEKRKLIMTEQTRVEFEQELIQLEQQIADYRQNKFGTNGELFQKQDELMRPVQNKIFNAIKEIAEEEDFDFIFDRSGDLLLLFAKEQHDITQKVLTKLSNK